MTCFRQPAILCLIFLSFVLACKNKDRTNEANTEFGNLSRQQIDTLRTIGQPLQRKEIDPGKNNIITGKSGTRLFIPANSIVNDKGEAVTTTVTIELKENYSIEDFITSNLQTVHNNDILQTQGMIYYNARSNDGTRYKIDKNKPIRIEFPVNTLVPGVQIFTGKRDVDGNMNWGEIKETSKLLIPFPIKTLSPGFFGECHKDFGITDDKEYYNKWKGDTYLVFDTISKYENSLLATREFMFRYYSYCMPDLARIYIANLDKNMWEIDEMMVQYFIKDSTERVNYQLSNPPPIVNGIAVTEEQKQAHQWLIDHAKEGGHEHIEVFKAFAAQKLTKIDTSRKVDTSIIRETTTVFVAYDALEFGWVNVDYFFKDPKAEKLKLEAKTNEEALTISLIIPGRNIVLTGLLKSDKTYSFTKEEDGYNKLPRGEKAIIVSIGIVNNKLFFADKEIIIGQQETETIDLKQTNAETIKSRLKSYVKTNNIL